MYINNNLFKSKKVHICKDCIKSYIYNNNNEIDLIKFKKILQLLDMPFYKNNFESAISDKKETFGCYYKNVALNHKGESWENGEIKEFNVTLLNSTQAEKDTILFWGRGLNDSDYEFLEEELFRLQSDFECSDVGMEMIMKDIAFINLEILKERAKDVSNQKLIKELIEARSKLMNDGNLKPIQATGMDKNEKVSFGVFAKKYENERPAPPQIDDEMKKYMEVFIPGHLAKMEGLNNSTVDRYEKELSTFTINFEDVFGLEDDE
jgi:hypothetical protein